MTTAIGTVTLSNDMVWEDEYAWTPVIAEAKQTVGGGIAYQEILRTSERGRNITLATENGQGFQRKTVVDALKAIANVVPASDGPKTYTLTITHNSLTMSKTIRFRNDIGEEGAVQFEQANMMDGLQKSTHWYKGKIYLQVW